MTIRPALTLLCLSVGISPSLAQTRQSDSQILQQILAEVKAMHDDMRITESTQTLIAEFEMQQGVVTRATESLDQAREKLSEVQRDLKVVTSDLAKTEDRLNQALNPEEKDN